MENQDLNSHTITSTQIKAFREKAMAHSDHYMVDWCDLALVAHEHCDSQGGDLVSPLGAIVTRTEAREVCASAIREAWLRSQDAR